MSQKSSSNWRFLSCSHRWLNLVRLAFAGLVFLHLVHAPVHARENYAEFASRVTQQPPEGASYSRELEQQVLGATNAYRASKGLPALKPASKVLLLGARAHAMDLLMNSGMGHTASTGHGFESRMRSLHDGQMVLAAMAENAARVRNSGLSAAQRAQRLVQMWVKSSGHRKNMVNRTYTAVAIGVAVRGDDVYAVQIFTGPEVKTNMWGKRTAVEE